MYLFLKVFKNNSVIMIKQIIIVSILITFILFLGYLGIEYLIGQLIDNVFAAMELN